MQRGLRFNKNKKALWLQYLRLEMSYIAKLQTRREILGIGRGGETSDADPVDERQVPALTADDVAPQTQGDDVDAKALENMREAPAQSGAIPIAIFDAAMTQFNNDPHLTQDVLYMLEDYTHVKATARVLYHLRDSLDRLARRSWVRDACEVWTPVVGLQPNSADFPPAFRSSLKSLREAQKKTSQQAELAAWAKRWLQRLLEAEDLDPAIRRVAESVSQSL